jgi:hypothetical protein
MGDSVGTGGALRSIPLSKSTLLRGLSFWGLNDGTEVVL